MSTPDDFTGPRVSKAARIATEAARRRAEKARQAAAAPAEDGPPADDVQVLLVYLGQRGTHDPAAKVTHVYGVLPQGFNLDDWPADATWADTLTEGADTETYGKAVNRGAVGSIYRHTRTPKGLRLGGSLVGTWRCQDDRVRWRNLHDAASGAAKLFKEQAKAGSRDVVRAALHPVQHAYRRCTNDEQRAALLARVVLYIQS